jgi:hypothetical protein
MFSLKIMHDGPRCLTLFVAPFVSTLSAVVAAERLGMVCQALKQRGLKELRFTPSPAAKHVYAQDRFKDPRLYEWMLRQKQT